MLCVDTVLIYKNTLVSCERYVCLNLLPKLCASLRSTLCNSSQEETQHSPMNHCLRNDTRVTVTTLTKLCLVHFPPCLTGLCHPYDALWGLYVKCAPRALAMDAYSSPVCLLWERHTYTLFHRFTGCHWSMRMYVCVCNRECWFTLYT